MEDISEASGQFSHPPIHPSLCSIGIAGWEESDHSVKHLVKICKCDIGV